MGGAGEETYLNDVEHGGELREQENFMATLEQLVQKPLEHHHFAAGVNELGVYDRLVGNGVEWPVE